MFDIKQLISGKEGGSDYSVPTPMGYDRSPAPHRPIQPGAWRNGHAAGSYR